MKRCTRCRETKERHEFSIDVSRKDGLRPSCRSCAADVWRAWRSLQEARKRPPIEIERARRRAWKSANIERERQRRIGYRFKDSARSALHDAVRRGLISRPAECSECHSTERKIHGHHHRGYDNALDVEWLCSACHGRRHRGEHPPYEAERARR